MGRDRIDLDTGSEMLDRIRDVIDRLRASHAHLSWALSGLDCPNCAREIQTTVTRAPGISSATVTYPGARLAVEFDPERTSADGIAGVVEGLGYGWRPLDGAGMGAASPYRGAPPSTRFWWHPPQARGVLFGAMLLSAALPISVLMPIERGSQLNEPTNSRLRSIVNHFACRLALERPIPARLAPATRVSLCAS